MIAKLSYSHMIVDKILRPKWICLLSILTTILILFTPRAIIFKWARALKLNKKVGVYTNSAMIIIKHNNLLVTTIIIVNINSSKLFSLKLFINTESKYLSI